MTFLGDLAVLVCLWGCACLAARAAQRVGLGDAGAVARLAGLGAWALVGWAACLLGFCAHPSSAPLEMLPMHPQLGPLFWLGGGLGLAAQALASAVRRARSAADGLLSGHDGGRAARWGPFGWAPVALACWLCALGPPLRPDESMYHLSLPLQYLRAGHFVVVPGHGNAGFLALGDMLFFWCLAAGAPGAARGVQLLVVLMGLAALAQLGRRWQAHRLPLAAWLSLGVPVVLWDVCCAYVDCIEAAFSLVGLVCLARWWDAAPSRRAHPLWAAAWLLGCGAACRHLALVQLPALALVVLCGQRRAMRQHAACAPLGHVWLAGPLVLLPPRAFVAHNVCTFGNPVFPFAAGAFAHARALAPSQLDVLEQFLAQHGPMAGAVPRFGLDALLHLPFALFFDAAFASPRFDGAIGWMPLVALAVGVWHGSTRLRRRWAKGDTHRRTARVSGSLQPLLLAFAGLRTAVWLSTSWQARFLIAPLCALALWLALAWPDVGRRPSARKAGRVAALTLAAAMGVAGWGSLRGHFVAWDWAYLGSPAARHAARLAQLPASGLCEQLGAQAGTARVMLVWTQRLAAFCPTALWSDSYDEAATLVGWLQPAVHERLGAQLRAHGITHLVVDEAAFAAQPPGVPAQDAEAGRRLQMAWERARQTALRPCAGTGQTQLYAVRAAADGL